jgi:hypothetical protein
VTGMVGTSRSKAVTRMGSRRHTAAEPNAVDRSVFGRFASSALGAAFSALPLQSQRILNENLTGNV